YETVVLLLITFSLFRPGFWMDMVYPPYISLPASQLMQIVEETPADQSVRVWVEGENINGDTIAKGVLLPLGASAPARQRLQAAGRTTTQSGDEVDILMVRFGSKAGKLGIEQGFRITGVEVPAQRLAKEW